MKILSWLREILNKIISCLKTDSKSADTAENSLRSRAGIREEGLSSENQKEIGAVSADPVPPAQSDPSESQKQDQVEVPKFREVQVFRPVHSFWKISADLGKVNKKLWPKRGYHGGVDFACPVGTEVRSALPGRVVKAGQSDMPGTIVYIVYDEPGIRVGHAYHHLSKLLCKAGDVVKVGDVIALSGQSGHAFGAHLHFQLEDYFTKDLYRPIFVEP